MSPITLVPGNNTLSRAMVPLPPLTANLSGIVTDASTGLPLVSVSVRLEGPQIFTTFTDVSGGYLFSGIPTGTYTAIFELVGYETLVI